MAITRRSLVLGLLAWATLSFTSAVVAQPTKPTGTRVSAVWLSGAAGSSSELLIAAGERAPVPLSVGRSNRGKPTHVELGAGAIRLYQQPSAGAVAAGPVLLGEIALPNGARADALLLVLASGAGNRIRGVALSDDGEAFPAGTVRVVNFSQGPLLMRLDRQVETVSPGVSRPYPYARVGDAKQAEVPSFPFALARENAVFFNGRIDGWPGSRTLIIIAPGASEKHAPVVRSLVDRAPAKPEKVAAR